MTIDEAVALFGLELQSIWLSAPEEIRILSQGTHPREVGSCGQYLTPIMFAEGSARSLADEFLWSVIVLCDRPELDIGTLKATTAELVGRKIGFFELIGLEHVSDMVRAYVDTVAEARDAAELKRLTVAMIAYVNRVHVWIDGAFPWGVCSGFMRPRRASAAMEQAK